MLKEGISLQEDFIVKKEHLATTVGSGNVEVLATPCLIAFIENVSLKLVDENIEDKSLTSVGYKIEIRHIAPAPLGARVTIKAILQKIEKRHLLFKVEAYMKDKLIAEGIHERVLVNKEDFIKKVSTS